MRKKYISHVIGRKIREKLKEKAQKIYESYIGFYINCKESTYNFWDGLPMMFFFFGF